MPTWKEVNAALQIWFSDEPVAPKSEVKIIVVIMDYFKGGK